MLRWTSSVDFLKTTSKGVNLFFISSCDKRWSLRDDDDDDDKKVINDDDHHDTDDTDDHDNNFWSLTRFLDLKKELSSFQREAEESDRVVNDFIKVN